MKPSTDLTRDVEDAGMARRSFLKIAGGGLLGLSAIPLLAACGGSSNSGGGSGKYSGQIPAVDVKSVLSLAPYVVAQQAGLFTKRGLNLSTVTSASGADIVREALASAHLGIPASTEPVVAFANGAKNLRVIASTYTAASLVFLVKKGSPITSVKDLRGKKIATSKPTALSTYFARTAVRQAGLNPDTNVKIEYIGGPADVWNAVENGLADCCWSIAPLATQLIEQGKAQLLFSTTDYAKNWIDNVVVADAAFLQSNGDVVRNILAAMGDAVSIIRTDPARAGKLWAAFAGSDERATVAAITQAKSNFNLAVDRSAMQTVAEAVKSEGLIKSVPDLSTLIDTSYLPKQFRAG